MRRRAYRTVIDEVFQRLVIWFAPIMVFTCEEAWEHRHSGKGSVHLQQFPATPAGWLDTGIAAKWDAIFRVRKAVTEALEVERREKRIGSSLEASVTVDIPDPALLEAFADEDPAEIFITSEAKLSPGGGETIAVASTRAPGVKCARSWKYFDPKNADPEFPDITPRDAAAVREYRGLVRRA
jgi:isoleucyl-tRNA synthetase